MYRLSSYTTTLSKTMTTTLLQKMIIFELNYYNYPVIITFTPNNNKPTNETPPKYVRKLQTDTSIITNTIDECNSYLPFSNSQTTYIV